MDSFQKVTHAKGSAHRMLTMTMINGHGMIVTVLLYIFAYYHDDNDDGDGGLCFETQMGLHTSSCTQMVLHKQCFYMLLQRRIYTHMLNAHVFTQTPFTHTTVFTRQDFCTKTFLHTTCSYAHIFARKPFYDQMLLGPKLSCKVFSL